MTLPLTGAGGERERLAALFLEFDIAAIDARAYLKLADYLLSKGVRFGASSGAPGVPESGLLPCPWCSGVVARHPTWPNHMRHYSGPESQQCPASGDHFIEAWNRRAASGVPGALDPHHSTTKDEVMPPARTVLRTLRQSPQSNIGVPVTPEGRDSVNNAHVGEPERGLPEPSEKALQAAIKCWHDAWPYEIAKYTDAYLCAAVTAAYAVDFQALPRREGEAT